MASPLRLQFPDGTSALVAVDPLSTFENLQARLPELLRINSSEAKSLAFYSENGVIFPMQQLIAQTEFVQLRVLLPRFSGLLAIYINSDLRLRHFIEISFEAATPLYRKLLLLMALSKLENDSLFAISELGSLLVDYLIYFKFAELIKRAKSESCPENILSYIKRTQLRWILLSSADDFYAKLASNDQIVNEPYNSIEEAALLELANLSRFPNLVIPAAELECYNSGELVSELTSHAKNCFLSISYTHIQKLSPESLEIISEISLSEFKQLYCYADCIVFEFSDNVFWTFATANATNSYEECKEYINMTAQITLNM